jgi:hypothetical protein
MAGFDADDTEGIRKLAESIGPGVVDQSIRQAVHFCWMLMPTEQRNTENLAEELRRILERALRDFAQDAKGFQ